VDIVVFLDCQTQRLVIIPTDRLSTALRSLGLSTQVEAPIPESIPAAMCPMYQAMTTGQTDPIEMALSIRLAGGDWLNVRTMFHRPDARARGRDRPAGARAGYGSTADNGAVRGARDTQAFNRMKDRLTRFVNERTQMLVALSHDLRSPLTAMRLRIEMLDETDDSIRLKALVEEMQAMVEATLEFARGVAKAESTATLGLAALLVDLVGDVGEDRTTLARSLPMLATIRPQSLKRALRNLIDNAVRYGGVAKVKLEQEAGLAVITISDTGPGLPKDQLEAVFEPYVRLECSRSRDTGGVGLGLAIARTIVQAHGGTVTLRNLPGGGLEASVHLPTGLA
jgi:signal transduction histidine kinase